jgi:hypothetical protein
VAETATYPVLGWVTLDGAMVNPFRLPIATAALWATLKLESLSI